MKPLTAEWIAKAEGDFALMEREGRVRKIRPTTASASMLSSVPRNISRPASAPPEGMPAGLTTWSR